MISLIASRFSGLSDVEYIKNKVRIMPDAVGNIDTLSPSEAAKLLRNAWKKIFVPTPFVVSFLQEIVCEAEVYCKQQFSSEQEYLRGIYTPAHRAITATPEVEPYCLTGLAGIGKSETIRALERLIPAPLTISSEHFSGEQEIAPYWYASARGKAGGRQMLQGFLNIEHSRTADTAFLLSRCQSRSQREGVPFIILDETQFITTGDGAARVTDILLTLAAIGPPMVYVSNFSLLHKLKKRNQEDTQRLITNVRIMHPDEPGSEAWAEYIGEISRVCGGRLIANEDTARQIYIATHGIKRLVVHLLQTAYIEARAAGRKNILAEDIDRAYKSSAYAASREDVEYLRQVAVSGKPSGRPQPDLVCPLDSTHSYMANVIPVFKEVRARQMEARVLRSSLSQTELGILNESVPTPAPKKRVPQVRASKVTDEELAAIARELIDEAKL